MRILLAKRHYVSDVEKLETFERAIDPILDSQELRKRFEVDLSMLISAPSDSLVVTEGSFRDRLNHAISILQKAGIEVSYSNNATAGRKFVRHLFQKPREDAITNPDGGQTERIYALCCVDQYPLHNSNQIEAARDLASKLIKDKTLYANGSRNIPVVLGVGEWANHARIIEELIYNITTGTNAFKTEVPEWANPLPAYERLGEINSGFYLVNPQADSFPSVAQELIAREDLIAKNGFFSEYLAAIVAGRLGSVSSGYVYAVRNPFSTTNLTIEEEKVRTSIRSNTRVLATTSIGDILKRTLSQPAALNPLHEFFDSSLVEEVREIMINGISSSSNNSYPQT